MRLNVSKRPDFGRIDGYDISVEERVFLALHRAFNQAICWGVLVRNPCDGVTPPQPRRREIRVLTKEQVAELFDATPEHPAHAPYVLAVITGKRQDELLGLSRNDVDLEAGKLIVRRALLRQYEAGLVFVEPKTSRSRRTIVQSQLAVVFLRQLRLRQLEARLACGADWQDQDLVFCHTTGGPLDASWQRHVFHVF